MTLSSGAPPGGGFGGPTDFTANLSAEFQARFHSAAKEGCHTPDPQQPQTCPRACADQGELDAKQMIEKLFAELGLSGMKNVCSTSSNTLASLLSSNATFTKAQAERLIVVLQQLGTDTHMPTSQSENSAGSKGQPMPVICDPGFFSDPDV